MRLEDQKNRTCIGPHLRRPRPAERRVISVVKIGYVRRSEITDLGIERLCQLRLCSLLLGIGLSDHPDDLRSSLLDTHFKFRIEAEKILLGRRELAERKF